MKLIDALKRLNSLHLRGQVSYQLLPEALQDAGLPALHQLRTSISTFGPFPSVGRHESATISQDLIDDAEALELFLVSELQRTLDVILEHSETSHQHVYQFWTGWLQSYRKEAEILQKDMNL